MKNEALCKALVAALQDRMLAQGNDLDTANAYTVGYLESVLARLCELSDVACDEITRRLAAVCNNK